MLPSRCIKLCVKKFGWGGQVNTKQEELDLNRLLDFQLNRSEKDANRRFVIKFNTQVDAGMPWYFEPTQEYIVCRPGETALAFFTAYNDSPNAITGVSTYTVSPYSVAPYFRKVQCFCFEEQRVRGKEKVDMPVLFYIDPAILDDKVHDDCYDVALSYTFFEVEEEEGEVEWDDDDDWDDEEDDALPASIAAPHTMSKGADGDKNMVGAVLEQNVRRVEQSRGWAKTVDIAHKSRATPGYDRMKQTFSEGFAEGEVGEVLRPKYMRDPLGYEAASASLNDESGKAIQASA